jgi:hypothetical protein
MFHNPINMLSAVLRYAVVSSLALLILELAAAPGRAQAVQPDIVFQHQTTGQVVDWLMNGTTLVNYARMTDPGSVNWKIVGTGDFDGDGKPDLLFQNQQTGQLVYWVMNETVFMRWGYISPAIPGALNWKVVAVADLSGDGKPDILFQSQTNGDLVYWIMNGTSIVRYGFLPNPGSIAWKVVGMGDLTGDGKADILFQNQQTGVLAYWQMNGSAYVTYGILPDPGSPLWRAVAVADLDGDSKADILFQHQTTGKLAYWAMNRTSLSSVGFIAPSNPGANWSAAVVWPAQSGSASGSIQ